MSVKLERDAMLEKQFCPDRRADIPWKDKIFHHMTEHETKRIHVLGC